MLIGCKHIFSLCHSKLCFAKQVMWTYLIFSFPVMYIQSHYVCSFRRFGRILCFCINNTTFFSALYLKNSLFDWKLKFKEMTEWFQNCRFFRKIFLNYPSNIKIEIRKLSAHDLHWENVIFWGCATLSYHANKHIDKLFKKNKYVS